MTISLSEHAKKRCQQRGFTREKINVILYLGEAQEAPGKAIKIKIKKNTVAEIESLCDKEIIMKDGKVLTVQNSR